MRGFQPSLDGVLQVDLIHRGPGGDDVFASVTLTSSMQNVDGGFPGDFDALIPAPAVPAACSGDQLVLRVKLVSGASPYSDFYPGLTTP